MKFKSCEVDMPERHEYPEQWRTVPVRYGIDEYADTAKVLDSGQITEPSTLSEALTSDHATEWNAATDSEYQSLTDNDTWELVELPADRKAISCKWVFEIKRGSDGKVDRYKARLVTKGYAQKYRVDYDETFSPVVRFSSIRALLAFAVQNDMLVHQMDVVAVFLNGSLDDEIYMQQPEGYVQPGNEHLVCKLKKSLYAWSQTIPQMLEHNIERISAI